MLAKKQPRGRCLLPQAGRVFCPLLLPVLSEAHRGLGLGWEPCGGTGPSLEAGLLLPRSLLRGGERMSRPYVHREGSARGSGAWARGKSPGPGGRRVMKRSLESWWEIVWKVDESWMCHLIRRWPRTGDSVSQLLHSKARLLPSPVYPSLPEDEAGGAGSCHLRVQAGGFSGVGLGDRGAEFPLHALSCGLLILQPRSVRLRSQGHRLLERLSSAFSCP